jgi:hypothetical protein
MPGANAAMQVPLLFNRPRSSMRRLRLPFRAMPARPDTGLGRGDTAATRHIMVACQTGCISDVGVPAAKRMRILQTNPYHPDVVQLQRRLLSDHLVFTLKFAFSQVGCLQPAAGRHSPILGRSSLNLVPTA